jgi:hypothetical protein
MLCNPYLWLLAWNFCNQFVATSLLEATRMFCSSSALDGEEG